jgi:hypothetical protein
MNASSAPLVISAGELSTRAEKFVAIMVDELTKFNEKNPRPEMSEEDRERVHKEVGDKEIPPLPKDFRLAFETVFCRYVASRYIIVPEI